MKALQQYFDKGNSSFQMMQRIQFIILMQRNIWSLEQDKALREIVEVKNIIIWSLVSSTMDKQYGLPGRTGKQCRQRWHNQLDPQFHNENWTKQEEQILFSTHNLIGNKWAQISVLLPGRTDNYIKNHFYSTIRKALRHFNRFLFSIKDREIRQIKNVLLNKILACAEDKFQNKMGIAPDVIQLCLNIKAKLLPFANITDILPSEVNQIKQLVDLVVDFNSLYRKKKPKKKKRVVDLTQEDSEEIFIKKQEISEPKSRISRHSLLSTQTNIPLSQIKQPLLIKQQPIQVQQVQQTIIPIFTPIPSVPIVANTQDFTDHIPDYIRAKLLTSNQDIIFDSPMLGASAKFFDSDCSRVYFPNPLSLQASAGPTLFHSSIFKLVLQSSTTYQQSKC